MAALKFDTLEVLCNELSDQIQALRIVDKDGGLHARRKATNTARTLLNELIHTEEAAAEQVVILSEWACLRMFMKWKFFDKIPLEGGISYQELAASIGAEEALVSRMGQMLVSTDMLLQPEPGHVRHSRLSPTYKTGDRNGSGFAMMHDDFQTVFTKLPGFFDKYGPNLPVGKTNVPMTFASGADGKLDPWGVLAQQGTEHIEQFGLAMQGMTEYLWPYTGAYDFTWVGEYAATNPGRTLIIDVGGSFGHALRANLVKFPDIPPSRCAVEDLEEMIPSIREAHADDAIMKDILADSLPEDEPRSRILINDQIMTNPPDRWVAALDVLMMTCASLERSAQQFERLASRAGLVVVKIHQAEGATMGVVECKKAPPS
ncbi:S-adenosyl-L-methionine-dependent methyltransferase [Annulohypoxylon bovei var. microspora]|nr:S-adenosyl-L-methionine-dependent methyltransferase [Annulohypoxylon bovei var. microspora]